MSTDIFIVSGARTPIGSLGGALAATTPTRLGATAASAAIARAAIDASEVEQAIFGQVIPTEPSDLYLGRTVAIAAGLSVESQGLTVNRLCGSGAEAIVQGARVIGMGESSLVLTGGAEVMSRAPYVLPEMRAGRKLGDGTFQDWLSGSLTDPFGYGAMGETAENLAEKFDISRKCQDEYAIESQRRAATAVTSGRFAREIAPVEVWGKRGVTVVEVDEYPNPNTSLDVLAGLKPVFRVGGTVTAGNSSGINDGAAALILASGQEVARRGLRPMARLLSWGHAGVEPGLMGIGPVDAVPRALRRAGLALSDMDVVESNEAFAAQAIAVTRGLGLDPARTNPNGGAIALGHPLGATGAIITVKAIYELRRVSGRYGLITLCIGGGQGIALVIENCAQGQTDD